MSNAVFIRAEELAQELKISKAKAYKMIRQWNEELRAKGYATVNGRVSRQYGRLQKRLYKMFGVEAAKNLYFGIEAPSLGDGLIDLLEGFVEDHPDTRLIIMDTLQKVRGNNDGHTYSSDYQDICQLKRFTDSRNLCVGCGPRKPPGSGAGTVEILEWRGTSHDAEFPRKGPYLSENKTVEGELGTVCASYVITVLANVNFLHWRRKSQ